MDELTAVGNPVSEADLTLRLIAGMLSDKRYEKECKEVSDQAEPYSTCHHVFMQRAQALGDLVTHKSKEEANAATTDRRGGAKRKNIAVVTPMEVTMAGIERRKVRQMALRAPLPPSPRSTHVPSF